MSKIERLYWYGFNLNFVANEPMIVSMIKYRKNTDRVICEPDKANLVSSQTNVKGFHLPVIDLDFTHLYIESLNAAKSLVHLCNIPKNSIHRWRPKLLLKIWNYVFNVHDSFWAFDKLILILPAHHEYIPSTTPGHGHLYLDVPVTRVKLFLLLFALRQAGIIEKGYFRWSVRRGSCFVRPPGVIKTAAEALRAEAQPVYGMFWKLRRERFRKSV